jgi:uncharacterized membrane protein
VAGLVVAALPLPLGWQFCGLLGWCAGIGVYLGLAWWLCVRFDAKRTRERAQAQDEPSVVLFLLMLLATMACVAAITVMMQQAKDLSGMERTLHILLSVAALAASWLFIQTILPSVMRTATTMKKNTTSPTAPACVFPAGWTRITLTFSTTPTWWA